MTGVLTRRGKYPVKTDTQGTSRDHRGRGWRDAAVSQGTPSQEWRPPPEARKKRGRSPPESQRSGALLAPRFWTPSLQDRERIHFCHLSYSVRYSCPRKRIKVCACCTRFCWQSDTRTLPIPLYLPLPTILLIAKDDLSPLCICIYISFYIMGLYYMHFAVTFFF